MQGYTVVVNFAHMVKPNILQLDADGGFFAHFFRHNPLPMWVFDSFTLQFLAVNDAAVNIYGYTRQAFLSMNIKDIRPVDEIEHLEFYVRRLKEQSHADTRWLHIKKDGTIIFVKVSSFEVLYKGVFARLVTVHDITDYVEQEKKVKIATQQLQEYVKAITECTILSIANRKGIITFANENFIKLTGYTEAELIGKPHSVINSGHHPKTFWKEMWNTVMKGNTWHNEVCNRKKNGQLYWVDSFIVPVSDEHGKIDKLFSFRFDITARKEKENEILNLNRQLVTINEELTAGKKEYEKLSLVAKLTQSLVLILNIEGKIVWVNDAFTRLTGYALSEVFNKQPGDFLQGEKTNYQATETINDKINRRLPFNAEIVHYTKAGDEICVIADGQPVLDAKGDLLQYVIVETNITELKKQQQVITESEIKLNAFFSSTANLHLLVDLNYNILAYNKVAVEFARKVMQTTITEGDYLPAKLFSPLKENFLKFAGNAIKGNETISRHIEIPLADGTKAMWIAHYLPAYNKAGDITGCSFSAMDITESRKAQEKLNQQNNTLRKIAWEQSHIVRAPLANILSITALLEENRNDTALLTSLKHETQKLDNIIRDIVNKAANVKNTGTD